MDSPDRSLTTTSTEAQGSPFFNFLCNLSPIKPVKSVHVAQTFSELSFPPPPPVFMSPRVDAQRNCSLTKSDMAGRAVGKRQAVGGVETVIVPLSVMKSKFSQSCILEGGNYNTRKKNSDEHSEPVSPNNSPSKLGNRYVEQYLADPIEGELYSVGISQSCTEPSKMEVEDVCANVYAGCLNDLQNSKYSGKQHLVTSAVPQVEATGRENLDATETVDCQIFCNGLESQDLAFQPSAKNVERTRIGGSVACLKCKIKETNDLPCESASATQQQDSKDDCIEDLSGLDKATSAFTFLMSDSEERISLDVCELKNRQDLSISDQQELYLVAMKEIIDEDMQEGTCSEAHANFHALTESKQEGLGHIEETKIKEASVGRAAQRFKVGNVLHRGARRRCLDFEASDSQEKNNLQLLEPVALLYSPYIQESFIGSDTSNLILPCEIAEATSNPISSKSPEASSSAIVNLSISGSKVLPPTSSALKLSRCSSQLEYNSTLDKLDSRNICSNHICGTSPMSSGMPSGIGLHLNSLAGSISFSQIRKKSSKYDNLVAPLKSSIPLPGKPHLSSMKEIPSESYKEHLLSLKSEGSLQVVPTADFGPGVVVSVVEKTRLDRHEMQATSSAQVEVTKSATCIRSVTLDIKPLEGNMSLEMDMVLSPVRKRMFLQDFSQQSDQDVHEDCSQQSPQSAKKKRGKSTLGTEKTGDGCRRCNCKKSKCLKLYCECFAAGVYCVDSCTCLDCFNKPEFEETVVETRQQIESRNPLAFAPKIIRTVDSSPIVGEECGDTPASARHKRGCNCKKSQCLKKYCECFQAGVGCSEVCRCEGCKNFYGRKEGSGEPEDKDVQTDQTEKEKNEEKGEIIKSENEFTPLNQQASKELFSGTPFHCAGQGRLPAKLKSFFKGRLNAEDVKSVTVSQSTVKSVKSPLRLLRSGRVQSGSKPASAGMHCSQNVGSPASVQKIARIGQFSPRWDGLGDICTITPLPQPPLRPPPASASIFDKSDSSPTLSNEPSSSCNFSIMPCSPTSTSDGHYFQTHVLNPQATPGSPLFSSPFCISRRKSEFGESSDICSQDMEEDYTPEFLKDPDAIRPPIQIIKTSSPKQKRVSPPHHVCASNMVKRTMPSTVLKSGCKFILRASSSVTPAVSLLLSTHGHPSSTATQDQGTTNSSNIT